MSKTLILFFFFISIDDCYCQDRSGDVLKFLSGSKGLSYTSGDSITKIFYSLNAERIENLRVSFSYLPIDRCHKGRIELLVEVDTLGEITSIHSKEPINFKMDSTIISLVKNLDGKWQTEYNGNKYEYKGSLTFLLFNEYSTVRSSRAAGPRQVMYKQERQYDPIKNCENADYYYDLGVKEFGKENYKSAVSNFNNALELNPYDLDALHNLAICYIKLDKKKDACKCFKRSILLGDEVKEEIINKYCIE